MCVECFTHVYVYIQRERYIYTYIMCIYIYILNNTGPIGVLYCLAYSPMVKARFAVFACCASFLWGWACRGWGWACRRQAGLWAAGTCHQLPWPSAGIEIPALAEYTIKYDKVAEGKVKIVQWVGYPKKCAS